jgi:hypothetical protein
VSEIEAATKSRELPANRRRWLAILVGIAAVLAALFTFAERETGRKEQQALQDATRQSLAIFVNIAGSSARSQFTADNSRRTLLVGVEGLARVIKTKGEAFKLATSRSGAEEDAQKRLVEVTKEMDNANGRDLPVDDFTTSLISSDEKKLRRLLASQNQAVDDANDWGNRSNRATYALGLTAIAAALLALAGMMGAARSGRIALIAAGVALAFAAVWGGSGFLL